MTTARERAPASPVAPAGSAPPAVAARFPFLLWLAGLAPFALLAWRFDHLTDDAYIAFRFARNLARGDGLVYNPGLPPVEGYSQLLWVLVLAVGERLGAAGPTLSRVLTLASGAGVLALLARLLARWIPARAPALWGMLFLGLLPPFAVWATGGLETMAITLAVLALHAALALEPARPRTLAAGAAAVAAVLLRIDGPVLVGGVLAAHLLLERRHPAMRRALWTCAALVVAAVLAQAAFRWIYYGEWMPNTARAKLHPGQLPPQMRLAFVGRGLCYAGSFLAVFPSAAGALLLSWAARGTPAARPAAAAGVVWACVLAYAAAVGGDFMAMFRLLVPGLPFLALALAAGLAGVRARWGSRPVHAAGAVLCAVSLLPAFGLHATPAAWRAALDFRWRSPDPVEHELEMWREQWNGTRHWAILGRALALHTRPGERIFLGGIGAIGYHCELEILDSYGLVTPEVLLHPPEALSLPAHDRQARLELFHRRPPDYLGAKLAPAADPYGVLPRELRPPHLPPDVHVDVHPLDPAAGFPPDSVLVLTRWTP